MEKLYTVENIAQMTGLTSRTIRNYIAAGRLRGRKIGSQWRFTEADIEALLSDRNDPAEESAASSDKVADFLRPQSRAGISTCTIIDAPAASGDAAEALAEIVSEAAASSEAEVEFTYLDEVRVARFIITGPADAVSKLVKIVRKKG